MIGQEIGNYRVLAQIGQGGMGAVYLAEHRQIGRKVAVKVILPDLSSRPEVLGRFFNEARATAQLRHPALVDVFDYGTHTDGSAYIMMEYLEGDSLGTRLKKSPRMAPWEAAKILRQIAEGVGVAHAAKIVHRDLKPDNIFLVPHPATGDDQVKILDFGIAKMLDADRRPDDVSQTRTGVMVGTPVFMAPEQCRGAGAHLIDHRADIYSLGGIAFRMLAGRPPFEYVGFGELIAAHLHEVPMALRAIDPSIPEALEALVKKALAKRPDDRHRSMLDIVGELDAIIATLNSSAYVAAGGRSTMVLPVAGAPVAPLRSPSSARHGAAGADRSQASPPEVGPSPGAPPAPVNSRTQVLQPTVEQSHRRSTTTLSGSVGVVETQQARTPSGNRPLLLAAAAAVIVTIVGVRAAIRPSSAPSAARPVYVEEPRSIAEPRNLAPAPPTPVPEPPAPAPIPAAAAPPRAAVVLPARKSSEPRPGPETRSVGAGHTRTIRITVANPIEQLTVLIDGRPGKLPVRLPADAREHVLRFESNRTRPENRTITADQDQVLELANKPKLLLD
jgi:serine/threonine protein kinase